MHDGYPAWSPDETKIVFSRRQESLGPGDLYITNADGTGEVRLTSDPGDEGEPVWSPDGQIIAYIGNEGTEQLRLIKASGGQTPGSEWLPRSGAHDIYVVGADGKGLTRITSDPSNSYTPAWSPDDRHIAFISDRDDNHNLYVMTAAGENVVRLSALEAGRPSSFS